jgi:hypothetical protein
MVCDNITKYKMYEELPNFEIIAYGERLCYEEDRRKNVFVRERKIKMPNSVCLQLTFCGILTNA